MSPPLLTAYVQSYYTATTEVPPLRPPLQGRTRADVCVVGGGIAGCSAALSLAERGYRVILLEAQRVGGGASGRSGGQVLPGLALEQHAMEQLAGADCAQRIWDLTVEGMQLLRQRIARHHIACDWIDGHLTVAAKSRQWRALERWHQVLRTRYRYHTTQLIERQALGTLVATKRYVGGLYDSNSGHLHPLRYTLGLADAAARAGVLIHEASPVRHYAHSADGIIVSTSQARVDCQQLLFAGNAWLGDTVPALARKILGIASYIVATGPLGEQCARELITNNAAVSDSNWILDYFRRSPDHRLLFGGRVSYSGIDVRAIAPATLHRMLGVFPQLAGTSVDYAWGCLVDITAHRAPHFGRLAPNVYFLQGFSGHGIALAGLAGTLVAEAMAGTAERFDVFAGLPHRDFPGTLGSRRALLVLAMLWYRLRDLL